MVKFTGICLLIACKNNVFKPSLSKMHSNDNFLILGLKVRRQIDFKISFPNQNIGYIFVSAFSNIIT